MKPSRLFVRAVARTVLLAMTAFTLVVALRVLEEPRQSSRLRFAELVTAEEADGDLPPGHPPIDGCLRLPPGHPPIDGQQLPAGHPPVDGRALPFPLFPQDGTSTL
jgi:hypothetical protein